ncbi:hypothetical protein GCM10023116_25520 [Kistimonas scapharcae]|uniref:Uncharacterized protein n=1 Tax=Kistimonas scapharcae TaxID=1036133 RepID=A0ABP8V3W8_9GAMM
MNRNNIPTSDLSNLWTANKIAKLIFDIKKPSFDRTYFERRQRIKAATTQSVSKAKTPTMPPCHVSLQKLPHITTPIDLRMMYKTWERAIWCGETWWHYSSELERYTQTHSTTSLQHLADMRPDNHKWLKRMRESLVDAKSNQSAREMYPTDFEGTVLTNQHINIMVGWINNSLTKIGLPKLQELAL